MIMPVIGCIFQEGLMRTGSKLWAQIGIPIYGIAIMLNLYMIIFGGAVAANGMFPQFRIGYESCGEQDLIGQWTSCFHLIGLGVQLSGQACALMLLITCLRLPPHLIHKWIIEEKARMLAKEKEEEERKDQENDNDHSKSDRQRRKVLDNTRDLVVFDLFDEKENNLDKEKS